MNYDLTPIVTRCTPFNNGGSALASVNVCFGPIMIRARLCKSSNGMFLSWPSRKNDNTGKWYDETAIADPVLRMKATEAATKVYNDLCEGEIVG